MLPIILAPFVIAIGIFIASPIWLIYYSIKYYFRERNILRLSKKDKFITKYEITLIIISIFIAGIYTFP